MDEIHAAAIRFQLENLNNVISLKRESAAHYDLGLKYLVDTVEEPRHKRGVYQLYMIKSQNRDALQKFLFRKGIETTVHYRKYIPFHPYYLKRFGYPESLVVTERLSKEVLSLPIHLEINAVKIDSIICEIERFFKKHPKSS